MGSESEEWNDAEIEKEIEDRLRANVGAAADMLANAIRARLPRRTGNLQRGVRVKVTADRDGIRAQVYNPAPHSHLIEMGHVLRMPNGKTVYRRPRPIMRQTFAEMQTTMESKLREGF